MKILKPVNVKNCDMIALQNFKWAEISGNLKKEPVFMNTVHGFINAIRTLNKISRNYVPLAYNR